MMYLTRAADMLYPFFMTVSFALGAVLGSFANVCISRWPQGLSVVKPASRCPQCGNAIAWLSTGSGSGSTSDATSSSAATSDAGTGSSSSTPR